MGNPVKHTDIAEEGLLRDYFTKEVIEATEKLPMLQSAIENVSKSLNKTFGSLKMDSLDDIEKINSALKKSNDLAVLNEKVKLAQAKAEQQLIKNGTEQLRQDAQLQKNSKQKQKDLDREIKLQQQQNSEFQKAQKELLGMKKALQELKFTGKDNTDEFKRMNSEFLELQLKVNGTKEAFGDFQHHVGNYKTGFNSLSNSVNQLTREMPAFANSVQTGFMAISNNLPIFFDAISKTNNELKAMKEQGEKVPSLFQALTSSVISWGTALSLGVTLLTVFGKQMTDFIGSLFKADEAIKLSYETQSSYYTKLKKILDERIEAQIRLNVATGKWTEERANQFKAERDQNQAVLDAEIWFNEQRVLNAKKFDIDIKKFTGKLPETAQQLRPDVKLTQQEVNILEARNKEIFRKNKEINDAYFLLEKEKNDLIAANQRKVDTELDASAAEKEKKEREKNKKKDKELTDQDKRVLDEMQMLDEKRIKDKENLKKWETESDLNRAKEEEVVWWDKENGVTLEYHNLLIQRRFDFEEEERQRRKRILEEELKLASQITQGIAAGLKKRQDLQQQSDQRMIDFHKRMIDTQATLAAGGKANTLAEQQAQAAKAEEKKIQDAKKAAKVQETIAIVETFEKTLIAALDNKKPFPQAFGEATASSGIVTAAFTKLFAGFYDGTESLGESDGMNIGGAKDNILIRAHKGERILGVEHSSEIPKGMSNEDVVNASLMYANGLAYLPPNVFVDKKAEDNYLLAQKLDRVIQAIESQPKQFTNLDRLGEWTEEIKQGNVKTIVHHLKNNSKPSLRLNG